MLITWIQNTPIPLGGHQIDSNLEIKSMIENTKRPPNGCIEENMLGVSVKFNLVAIKPKVDVLKTKAKHIIHNNTTKNLIDLKRTISNIQLKKSR